jgi:hypothetical protein
MKYSKRLSHCADFYCDANQACGQSCAEVDIQEASRYAWRSTLHAESDDVGSSKGHGGTGGPRDWTDQQYGPGGECIDTSKPFDVAASFPVNSRGSLVAMRVTLSQEGRTCALTASVDSYQGLAELSKALALGMTPVVSYVDSHDLLWLDGRGADGRGRCPGDASKRPCSDSVKFYNFSIGPVEQDDVVHEGRGAGYSTEDEEPKAAGLQEIALRVDMDGGPAGMGPPLRPGDSTVMRVGDKHIEVQVLAVHDSSDDVHEAGVAASGELFEQHLQQPPVVHPSPAPTLVGVFAALAAVAAAAGLALAGYRLAGPKG